MKIHKQCQPLAVFTTAFAITSQLYALLQYSIQTLTSLFILITIQNVQPPDSSILEILLD